MLETINSCDLMIDKDEIDKAYASYLIKEIDKYMKESTNVELKYNIKGLKVKHDSKFIITDISIII